MAKGKSASTAAAAPPPPAAAAAADKRRTRPKHVLLSLQRRLQHVQQECDGLQAQHTALASAEAVLAELCEGVAFLQLCQRAPSEQGPAAAAATDARASQQLSALLEREGELLQLLQEGGMPPRPDEQQQQQQQQGHGALPARKLLPRTVDAIAPASDPLYVLRRLASPAVEGTSALTAADLARQHREAARGVGLQLQLLGCGSITCEAASRAIEGELIRLYRLTAAVMLTNRRDVLYEYCGTNLDTLQPIEHSDAPADRLQPAAQAVPHLNLTALQEQRIALMLPVWRRCLQSLEADMARLRQQIAADVAPSSAALGVPGAAQRGSSAQPGAQPGIIISGSSSAGARVASHPGSSADGAAPTASSHGDSAVIARIEHLDESAARAGRLRALLYKMAVLNLAANAWVVGQLSWLQMAELIMRCYPYVPIFFHMAQGIHDRWQARLAGEAEQQQQQQPAAADSAGLSTD